MNLGNRIKLSADLYYKGLWNEIPDYLDKKIYSDLWNVINPEISRAIKVNNIFFGGPRISNEYR